MKKSYLIFGFALFLCIFIFGCIGEGSVKTGDSISILYSAYVDGALIDNGGGKPLTFVVGSGQVIKGMDLAVIGMKKGEAKNFTLAPEDAYGNYFDNMVRYESKEELKKQGVSSEDGTVVYAVLDNNRISGTVFEFNESYVKIDFNHPLAGKEMKFDIQIVSIND